MTIHDPSAFCAGLWDWSILSGCFGKTNIEPTDVDGMVERNGHFLVLETKAPNVQVPDGQMSAYKELLNTGKFTVMIIWGKTNAPESIQVMGPKGINKVSPCDLGRLRKWVSRWFKYADSIW